MARAALDPLPGCSGPGARPECGASRSPSPSSSETLQGPSFAWSELRGFHDRVNAAESNNEAQAVITCQISGDTLTATITRPLTPAEELQQVAAERREAERALLARS